MLQLGARFTVLITTRCVHREDPYIYCTGSQTARRRADLNPTCWDHNDTVDSRTATCRLEDGTEKEYCLEFAFSSNGFVMECRGEYESDLSCGTYVELHRIGSVFLLWLVVLLMLLSVV